MSGRGGGARRTGHRSFEPLAWLARLDVTGSSRWGCRWGSARAPPTPTSRTWPPRFAWSASSTQRAASPPSPPRQLRAPQCHVVGYPADRSLVEKFDRRRKDPVSPHKRSISTVVEEVRNFDENAYFRQPSNELEFRS